MDFLEFPDVFKEDRGAMNSGRLKMTNQGVIFKNGKTGKVEQASGTDIDTINWQRLASGFGLRIMMKNGTMYRFGGFQEEDQERLSKFFVHNFDLSLGNRELCLKGWNWGTAKFEGSVLSFDIDKTSAFEIPLGNVSHCTTAKNEITLEFHQNDDAAVSLMELRFHIPTDASSEVDPVQAFRNNVLSKASIIQATGDAIAIFKELQCLTPRGRYDIKLFPTFIQLHGKTFDYKIPLTTVLRLFLLPHKDNRQVFFVLSLDPPIKQGQTRYHYLILLFNKEEETTIELGMSEEAVKEKFEDKIQKQMSGPTFEVISRVMKAVVQRKITIPGNFTGHGGVNCITCSHRAGNGLLYPLERGFIYVHKPPVHIRFDEIASVNFARSGGSTRSFDFEIETKSGVVHTFSSIEKEEYGKLFDYVANKKLRIKNRGSMDKEKVSYNEDELVDSDREEEPDAYLARVKDEGRQREEDGESDDESSDESFNPGESGSEVAEEFDSNPETSPDSEAEMGDSGEEKKSKKPKKTKEPKKSRSAKTVKEPGMQKKRKKKKVKDENRPKRPPSAYFLWLSESREKIKQDNPGISITEISKKAGELWKQVSDKSKYEEKAAEAAKAYKVAMEEYKANLKNNPPAPGSDDSASEKKPRKKAAGKKETKPSVKSPVKTSGSFKSKEYVSSSGDSSDSDDDDKPLKPKKESKGKKSASSSGSDEDKPLKPKQEKSDEEIKSDEEEEEILSTPPSSGDEDMSASD